MSDLQRSFAKAKLAALPFQPPLHAEEDEEGDEGEGECGHLRPSPDTFQDDDSSSSASSASSTDPLPWNDYFTRELYLNVSRPTENVIFHAYIVPPTAKGPLLVTHHGAGSSGLSFALFALEVRKTLPNAGVLSLDARGHGETVVEHLDSQSNNADLDLSLETLSQDLLDVIHMTQTQLVWPELPRLVLIGHSLGGAVVTNIAVAGKLGNAVLGYAVLDVVEGSAIDALQSMHSYLSTRPKSFPSIASGIEWHTRSRTIRNSTSARISVPSLLRREPSNASNQWTWRTDLAATQPYWEGWFAGLSRKFLDAKGGKLLLLAGTDRLDKELMIGQMQGKYQLQVFPEAGHFIHEDQAEKTAMVVADFYRRNDTTALVLPPKVGAISKPKTLA
ncbi:MAG: Protein with carboxyl methyl esterase activity [Alectoria sarmentosa]|nr:MAG: Protein with carboxyl methyl esterase activity [Alectoria sarmentosa]CAD6588155.1 MAG: Protein with carboxyl methyl esterase activity [Alectoria sarmentosa]